MPNFKFLVEYFWYKKWRYSVITGSFFSTIFMYLICRLKGLQIGKKVKFTGLIRIRKFPQSEIVIGDNCRFNSSRNSIPIGLTKPCSIVTLRKNAKLLIGNNVGCSGVTIAAAKQVRIGNNVLVGAYAFIMDTDWHNPDPYKRNPENLPCQPVEIQDNVFIGYNSVVLKGVTIGSNSVVGANSVVINNIPPNSIAFGNPCKVLLKRNWRQRDANSGIKI